MPITCNMHITEGEIMAAEEPTIVEVTRTPDPMAELGPDSQSAFTMLVRGRLSDDTYVDLFTHRQGAPDVADQELIGLTEARALALLRERGLHR
jgi:hypothetical protein